MKKKGTVESKVVYNEKSYKALIKKFKNSLIQEFKGKLKTTSDRNHCLQKFRNSIARKKSDLYTMPGFWDLWQRKTESMLDNKHLKEVEAVKIEISSGKLDLNYFLEKFAEYHALEEIWPISYAIAFPEKIETKSEPKSETLPLDTKLPYFIVESIPLIIATFDKYIHEESKDEFAKIITTWRTAKSKIIFMTSGKKLADAFIKFWVWGILQGCEKQMLEAWLMKNFKYYKRGNKASLFKASYLHTCISSKYKPYKYSIINEDDFSPIKKP